MIVYQTIKPYRQAAIAREANRTRTIEAMAATMQDMDAAGEPVTPQNLEGRGYSAETIRNLAIEAASLARKNSVKTVRA